MGVSRLQAREKRSKGALLDEPPKHPSKPCFPPACRAEKRSKRMTRSRNSCWLHLGRSRSVFEQGLPSLAETKVGFLANPALSLLLTHCCWARTRAAASATLRAVRKRKRPTHECPLDDHDDTHTHSAGERRTQHTARAAHTNDLSRDTTGSSDSFRASPALAFCTTSSVRFDPNKVEWRLWSLRPFERLSCARQ